jgi:hypothetical protein
VIGASIVVIIVTKDVVMFADQDCVQTVNLPAQNLKNNARSE